MDYERTHAQGPGEEPRRGRWYRCQPAPHYSLWTSHTYTCSSHMCTHVQQRLGSASVWEGRSGSTWIPGNRMKVCAGSSREKGDPFRGGKGGRVSVGTTGRVGWRGGRCGLGSCSHIYRFGGPGRPEAARGPGLTLQAAGLQGLCAVSSITEGFLGDSLHTPRLGPCRLSSEGWAGASTVPTQGPSWCKTEPRPGWTQPALRLQESEEAKC